jgi:hypothetical protein
MRSRSARAVCLGLTALLAGATAGCSVLAQSSSAAGSSGQPGSAAAPPAPMAVATARVPSGAPLDSSGSLGSSGSGSSGASGALGASASVADYKGSLILDATGAQLESWNKTPSYCPQTSGMLGNGTVGTDSLGEVTLTTSGKAGSCVALISPGGYSSAVIEADIGFPALPGSATMANWTGFWLTDSASWPESGELDGVEVEPVNASNAVTWHSGTASNEFSASTSGFSPVQLPVDGNNLSPGWHVVDIVYTRGFFAVYYDGQKYTSYTSSNVTGSPLNIYLTMGNTPDTPYIEQKIGSPPINSDPSTATLSARYVKVWSLR